MTLSGRVAAVALVAAMLMPALSLVAGSAPYTAKGEERKAILDALREPVQRDLGQPVEFVVDKIAVASGWAFVIATPQRPGGAQIAWSKTVCKGDVSHLVGGLMKQEQGGWTVRAMALCPTDVAWETWPQEHGAPPELFAP